jgi:hypothetical protein
MSVTTFAIRISLIVAMLGLAPLTRAQDADPGPKLEESQQKALQSLVQRGVLAQPLAAGSNWYYVNFRGAERPDAELFGLLKGLVGVVELDLSGQKLGDADLTGVATLSNLRKLSLARSTVKDTALVHLKGLQKLESLNLFSTEISDAGVESLKTLKRLKRLYVFQSKITDAGVANLKSTLSGLTVEQGAVLTLPPAPEPKKDEPKKDEPKKDEPKKDEPKKDEPKKDESKKDESKKDESKK